ncbi:NAD(P)-dependent oxidoreductase [Algimonas arctica]|uniref:dTDP-4-dehydrorhamnose reductase n=1 Tax=Algimonas arctica TaxID=1479486 RepID=A0A8J3CTY0_9PROT|nr:dTDP-4-dehydrorhamnose reductase [Algimonas arctica]GHA99527.1 NAD(P)-dependent oxidoreductase [Algimonas arctica]
MGAPLLVFGQTGQLARALARLVDDAITIPRATFDLAADPAECRQTLNLLIDRYRPRGVINAAAYTHVDRAESERALAFRINAETPALIAQTCARETIPFVHISTDYVFDGDQTRPWREDDPTKPMNVYGQSKLAGELGVQDAGGQATILRTSWVYDLFGRNFVTTMLRLAEDTSQLRVVDDQIGRPTHANVLAMSALAALGQSGLFHVSGTGDPVSWAGFASEIFRFAKWDIQVTPVPSSEYPTAATRPSYSVLDVSKFEQTLAPLPDWRKTLRQAINQRG